MKNHSQLIIGVSFAIKHDVKKVLQYYENINSDQLFQKNENSEERTRTKE